MEKWLCLLRPQHFLWDLLCRLYKTVTLKININGKLKRFVDYMVMPHFNFGLSELEALLK